MSTPRSTAVDTWSIRYILRTMAPLLVVLVILELGSGFVLESLETTYRDNPALLVLVPVMIGMGGNLGSIVASRLSTQLHLGTVAFDPREEPLRSTVLAILALAVTVFTTLAVAVYALGRLVIAPMALVDLLVISLASGLLLAIVAIALGIGATALSYRRGYDPDDVTIPVVTNVCDVLGVVILSGVSLAVL